MLKISRVEKLGDVCAFKSNEIQVVGNIYDRVPEDSREDMAVIFNNAKDAYDAKVAQAKASGEKPKSAQYKSEVISDIVKPFLSKFGLEPKKEKKIIEKVIAPKAPKITDAKDPVQLELTSVDKKTAESYYDNNFPSDMLDDSIDEVTTSKPQVELGTISDDFDLDGDDFDFDGF